MDEFWKDAVNRVLYTMAETALGIIGGATIIQDVNWGLVVSAVLLSGVVTALKCIVVDIKTVKEDDVLTDEDIEKFEEEDEDDYDELEQE